jgi:hypothetical protein
VRYLRLLGEAQGSGEMADDTRGVTRRQVLAVAGVAGAGLVVARLLGSDDEPEASAPDTTAGPPETDGSSGAAPAPPSIEGALWSDPDTWGGAVPGSADVAVVDRDVVLDVDTRVAGVEIADGASLVFDPGASRHLASSGNVVVAGRLVLRPGDARTLHRIEFVDVDEGRFEGGHSEAPLDTDVGLWVVGGGLLDAAGTAKTAWTHLVGDPRPGTSTISVDDATGWEVGDEVVITPTEAATVEDHSLHHDRRTIARIDGTDVTLDEDLEHPHSPVEVRDGVVHRAEVLNLTRNVRIDGTPEGRSHAIFLATSSAQSFSNVALAHMGPRQGDEEVLGRYAVHFHACDDGSRGTEVRGVVVHDSTGHAFASHLSNGVAFRECIAHDIVDDAFWWDLSLDGGGRDLVPSHDIVYDRSVAHLVRSGANSRFNLTGFMMGAGDGNEARGCVAVGVQGGAESSAGFHWPSHSRDQNTWTFEDNLAHNNRHSGIYFWQNGAPRTIVTRFTAYHCGQGIFAGSYQNLVSYRDCTIYACSDHGLVVSALPSRRGESTGETITYEGMYIDQAGQTDHAVTITPHLSRGGRVTLIEGCTFRGGRLAQVGIPEGGEHPQLYDIVDCTFDGNELWLADDVPPDTLLRVIEPDGDALLVRRADQPGQPRPEWNASVSPE